MKTLGFQFSQVNCLLRKETKPNQNNTVERNIRKSKTCHSQSPGHNFKLSKLLDILEKKKEHDPYVSDKTRNKDEPRNDSEEGISR